ncbi:homoserine dehydrogenase [Adhaeribacter pallidiroseus]|uniref:Homoserine dehydrogenase n=1 Tax=Adhaeribacter pallidiroseus TaxID=2072847 RepID=A0A369QQY8_9BACT|nr:homoserine dehydrogenase [Adhaeribacter pallidiroseus]RDC65249.1 Homoserine dehydrogenase [Adhaeribacter pallidiroseus]
MTKIQKIGLFGFGCVGQGLYDVLANSRGIKASIEKICVKDRNKKRKLPASYFTFEKDEVLNNPEIDLIVELIDNADEAFEIVATALKQGKNVVTANKKMVAQHLEELVELQHEHQVSLLYEASCCGSIPIIRTLEEYYDNELLYAVSGIFNGSSNYILSKIFNENLDYDLALKQAQDLGFAETDPTLDVGGFDPKYKLIIIAAHAFGLFLNPDTIFNVGIQNLSKYDIQYAREKDYKIKLVPHVSKVDEATVTLFVMPQFISRTHPLYNVDNEYNGVIVEAAFSEKQFFSGKGAGGYPTGSAVLSDISALTYGYKYEYKKHLQHIEVNSTNNIEVEVYLRYSNKELLKKLQFESISEKFIAQNFKYVIGYVRLDHLLQHIQEIREFDAFLVSTGNFQASAATPASVRETATEEFELI